MPKVSYYDDSASNDAKIYTDSTDPRTWHWGHPVKIKSIDSTHTLGVDADVQDGHVKYGIFTNTENSKFLDEENVVSAVEIQEMPGAAFDVPDINKVAVMQNVTTIPEERNKGWAKILYQFLIDKYKVLFSDTELFSDKNTENKTVSIWKNFLPKLGTVLNWNAKTHTYKEFDPVEGLKSEDIRFVVVADKNIANTMLESFSNWMKKGVTGAALTGLMSMPLMGIAKHEPTTNQSLTPPYPPPIEQPKTNNNRSALAPEWYKEPQQPQKIEAPSNKINVNIIAQLESGGNAKVGTNSKGASGLCQLKKAAWDEAAKSLYGKNGARKYPFATYAKNGKINKIISDHYYNVVLPKHLEAFDLPITKDTLLAAYNWGSNNLKKAIRNNGENWLRYAPKETQSYIERYHNIEKTL
jgi:hypothetical protein